MWVSVASAMVDQYIGLNTKRGQCIGAKSMQFCCLTVYGTVEIEISSLSLHSQKSKYFATIIFYDMVTVFLVCLVLAPHNVNLNLLFMYYPFFYLND